MDTIIYITLLLYLFLGMSYTANLINSKCNGKKYPLYRWILFFITCTLIYPYIIYVLKKDKPWT